MPTLTLFTRSGSQLCDWASFALFRDNVQHYIEHGKPGPRFSALHAIEDAVDGAERLIDAALLREEVIEAWRAIGHISATDAAVSLRTRAIMTNCRQRPAVRCTIRARDVDWELPTTPAAPIPLAELVQPFVDAVLTLTESTRKGDELKVRFKLSKLS